MYIYNQCDCIINKLYLIELLFRIIDIALEDDYLSYKEGLRI